jgi:hypothetical protein
MPTLYIANASKQRHDLIYRIPEESAPRRQQIPAGGQIVVYQPNASMEVLSVVVEQHLKYGLMDVAEIDRRKPFIGLCYRFDKPIDVEKIMQADEHNSDVLDEQSLDARKLSAAALHGAITEATGGAASIESLELEVVQQNGPGQPGLNERVIVSRSEEPPRPRGRTRKAA